MFCGWRRRPGQRITNRARGSISPYGICISMKSTTLILSSTRAYVKWATEEGSESSCLGVGVTSETRVIEGSRIGVVPEGNPKRTM